MMIEAASPAGTDTAITPRPMMMELVRPSIIARSFHSLTNQSSVKDSNG